MKYWAEIVNLILDHCASLEQCERIELVNRHLLFFPAFHQEKVCPDDLDIICKYLVSIGCDMEFEGDDHRTPLLETASSYRQCAAPWLKVLIANGSDLTATDSSGRGLFHYLFLGFPGARSDLNWRRYRLPRMYKEFKAKACTLLEAGCNPYKPDLKGHPPACYRVGDYEVNEKLHELWQSLLTDWIGQGGIYEQRTCDCGGLYIGGLAEEDEDSWDSEEDWLSELDEQQGANMDEVETGNYGRRQGDRARRMGSVGKN